VSGPSAPWNAIQTLLFSLDRSRPMDIAGAFSFFNDGCEGPQPSKPARQCRWRIHSPGGRRSLGAVKCDPGFVMLDRSKLLDIGGLFSFSSDGCEDR
jgi:hypothetical protein